MDALEKKKSVDQQTAWRQQFSSFPVDLKVMKAEQPLTDLMVLRVPPTQHVSSAAQKWRHGTGHRMTEAPLACVCVSVCDRIRPCVFVRGATLALWTLQLWHIAEPAIHVNFKEPWVCSTCKWSQISEGTVPRLHSPVSPLNKKTKSQQRSHFIEWQYMSGCVTWLTEIYHMAVCVNIKSSSLRPSSLCCAAFTLGVFRGPFERGHITQKAMRLN